MPKSVEENLALFISDRLQDWNMHEVEGMPGIDSVDVNKVAGGFLVRVQMDDQEDAREIMVITNDVKFLEERG